MIVYVHMFLRAFWQSAFSWLLIKTFRGPTRRFNPVPVVVIFIGSAAGSHEYEGTLKTRDWKTRDLKSMESVTKHKRSNNVKARCVWAVVWMEEITLLIADE